ncbi:MAG TPA: TetR/AcrR family transcriptional regulator [Rhodanobacteraceae bacterium]
MEKRAAILAAAIDLFTHQGFEGTSMDAVASAAGVSKLTVYSHYGDKDNLFREVVRTHTQELLPEHTYRFDPAADIRENLLRVALTHVRIDCDRQSVGAIRAILGDCRHGHPRYGRLIWEEGAMRTHRLIEQLLVQAVQAGCLAIDDPSRAADQFLALVKGNLLWKRLFGCIESDKNYAVELEANARAGVDMFLRAYLPR